MRKLTKVQQEIETLAKRLQKPSDAFRRWDARLRERKNYKDTDEVYESFYSVIGRFSIERAFQVGKDYCDEVAQWWFDTESGVAYYRERHHSLIYGGNYGYRFQGYRADTPFQFKKKSGMVDNYGYRFLLPYQRGRAHLTKQLKMKGATPSIVDRCDMGMGKVSSALKDPRMETIIKHSKKDFPYFVKYGLSEAYWTAYKITIRHGYTIQDISQWCDVIDMMLSLGMDIHNPVFVCSKEMDVLHDKLLVRKEKERKKKEAEEEKKKIAKREAKYVEEMQKYFGLLFITQSGISISPLKSVKAFYDEGEALHHCVYECGYYAKKDVLCLSARSKDGNRLETIEVDLNEMKVSQSRGLQNKPTASHKEILQAMKDNMWQIAEIANPRTALKVAC